MLASHNSKWKSRLFSGTFLVLTILVAFFYFKNEIRYFSTFHYNLHSDYIYAFPKDSVTQVVLERDGFRWPAKKTSWDTAFLKITVRSGWMDVFFKPFIGVSYGNKRRRQYFEKTAQGIRYLDLSSLVEHAPALSSSDKIMLEGHHCSWIQGPTELYRFQNQDPHKARILVISPHPDDAELAAFGFFEGKDAYIITITAGEEGKFKYARFFPNEKEHALFQGTVRTWDSLTVPFWGEIMPEKCFNLGYFDHTLKDMFQNPSRKMSSIYAGTSDLRTYRQYNTSSLLSKDVTDAAWNNLVTDLSQLLTTIAPDIIVTPNPLMDGHPDHEYSTIALLEAIQKAGIKKGALYLYTVHDSFTQQWPFGKAKSLVSLPPYFSGLPFFEKIYVENLSSKSFTKKYFAFDDLHSLRSVYFLSPNQYCYAVTAFLQSFYIQWKSAIFMRKFLRNQELFFVVPVERAKLLREEFLKNPPLDN
jgi:LmbE family N-acetylglucosaminyl deacetylase